MTPSPGNQWAGASEVSHWQVGQEVDGGQVHS